MSATANRVIKNTGWLYAKMAITMFVSLYTTRLILNGLGASDFGIYNIVGGAIAMLGFLNAAMAGATQRFMNYTEGAGDPEKKKTIFNVSVAIHGILAVIVGIALAVTGIILLNGVLNIPDDRRMASVIVYASMTVSTILTITTVPYDAVLNSHENMKYYALVGVVESLLKLTVAFVCVYSTYDKLIVYGILMACIPFLTLTVERIYCHTHYDECVLSIQRMRNKSELKDMTKFAGCNLMATAVTMLSNSGASVIMNIFFGTVVNAAQGISQQICGQLMSVTGMLAKAVNPVITKTAGSGDSAKLHQMAITSSKIFFFLCSLIATPSIILMPEIMRLWLKSVPEFAVFFAQCQLIVILCEQLVSGLNSMIVAIGVIKEVYIVKSLVRVLYLPVIYIMFSIGMGPISSYIALFVIHGFVNQLFFSTYFANKLVGVDWKYYTKKVICPALIVFLGVLLFGYFLTTLFDGLQQILFVSCITIVIYTILYYSFVFDQVEKMITKEIIKNIRCNGRR